MHLLAGRFRDKNFYVDYSESVNTEKGSVMPGLLNQQRRGRPALGRQEVTAPLADLADELLRRVSMLNANSSYAARLARDFGAGMISGQMSFQSSRSSRRETAPSVCFSMSTQRAGEIGEVPAAICERKEGETSN
jgi:hypothetical protein